MQILTRKYNTMGVRYIALLLFFMLVAVALQAQVGAIPASHEIMAKEDTVPVKERLKVLELDDADISLDEEEGEALSDELETLLIDGVEVPSHALYKMWTNVLVNPYNIRLVDKTDTTTLSLAGYCHPLTKNNNFPRHVTSEFGFRRGFRHHYGIDLKLNTGDSVFCAFDGMVRIARRGKAYGNYVVVRHNNGLETVYAHLSKITVNVNQVVKAGDMLGKGGSTGRSTGPHLHYELRYLGVPIPPRELIDFDHYCVKSDTLLLTAQQFNYIKEIEKVRFWTVKKGDTLGRIAQRTGTSLTRLCQLNNLRKTSIIRVGQRIRYT